MASSTECLTDDENLRLQHFGNDPSYNFVLIKPYLTTRSTDTSGTSMNLFVEVSEFTYIFFGSHHVLLDAREAIKCRQPSVAVMETMRKRKITGVRVPSWHNSPGSADDKVPWL